MSNQGIADLFNVRSHNPSYFSVKSGVSGSTELLDFCIPVNLHFPPPELLDMVSKNLNEIVRYYPDYLEVHQQHVAAIAGLTVDTIVPCNGSTEIITKLCQTARGPILTSVPTFSRWTDLPEELHVPLFTIQRSRENDFRLEAQEIIDAARGVAASTIVISNPNNPTGAGMSLEQVRRLASSLSDLDAVIVDESFIDFSTLESCASHVCEYGNLVVVKSLGKSLGWHGVRLGYAVAEARRASAMRGLLPFWNINGLAAFILRNVTRFLDQYRSSFVDTAADRNYMQQRLAELPTLTVYPSNANFLFVELPDYIRGRTLRDQLLREHGIMIRECSNKIGSSEQYLRLAVQPPAAVDRLIVALRQELSESSES